MLYVEAGHADEITTEVINYLSGLIFCRRTLEKPSPDSFIGEAAPLQVFIVRSQ
jgi:hypothetical protein